MTDLSGMIRWNANFVRGLAESVLNRAKVIRSSLSSGSTSAEVVRAKAPASGGGTKKSVTKKTQAKPKRALKKAAVKRATSGARRAKRS